MIYFNIIQLDRCFKFVLSFFLALI